MEKLRDLKLSELHLMATASGSGSGKCTCVGDQVCDLCRGDVDPVEIWGSGSGSGNSAATCRKCGTPYDSWGMCPNCGSGSGSGSDKDEEPVFGGGGGLDNGNISDYSLPKDEAQAETQADCVLRVLLQLLKHKGSSIKYSEVKTHVQNILKLSDGAMFLRINVFGFTPGEMNLIMAESFNSTSCFRKEEIINELNKKNLVSGIIITSRDSDGNIATSHNVVIKSAVKTSSNQYTYTYYDPLKTEKFHTATSDQFFDQYYSGSKPKK